MNYRKPFFVLLAGVLLLSAAPGRSQTFENPSIQGSSSFAVITDSRTARECRPQMTAYKQTLEAEGLPVYIVSHDWTHRFGVVLDENRNAQTFVEQKSQRHFACLLEIENRGARS